MKEHKIIIIGAGGHAKVVCDSLQLSLKQGGGGAIVGFVDDDLRLSGKSLLGFPILGPVESLVDLEFDSLIVGVGDNRIRRRVYEWAKGKEYAFVNAIHPTAVIASDVSIGEGATIFGNVVVNSGTSIGNNVILNTACTVDHDCSIADHVHIAPGVHLAGGVVVGEDAFVGIGASIIPYKKVGKHSVIGAGVVVVDDIPDGVTAVSGRARVIKSDG